MNILENYVDIKLSESNRSIIRDALEAYRNEVTAKVYGDTESVFDTEYHDIMLDEIDEIMVLMVE
jgi:hypothetical protein